MGRVEDLIWEGKKPDTDSDDAPIHFMGYRITSLPLTTQGRKGGGHVSTAHFAFALYCYNLYITRCCPYHSHLLLR